MDWKIPLFKIAWDEQDTQKVDAAIRRGMFWAAGPNIEAFEHGLADYLGIRYAAVFNSGTSALHAVLMAHGIGPGDEVIVPSFTFISTANSALFTGARPVFADIEATTYGLDPEDVKKRITPATKAIVPVHYAGSPCLIRELKQVADANNILLIEDAAESLGATVDGKYVGTFGNSAILSFCSNKVITTGEGGAVVTESGDIYNNLLMVRSHGRDEKGNYFSSTESMDYVTLGYNFRMSDITAALGVAQLGKLDRNIETRRKHAERYISGLNGIDRIEIDLPPAGYTHVYQMFTIRVTGGQRDELSKYLAEKGIMTKVYFSPIHHTHFYKTVLGYTCDLPVTERISEQVLTLPMYPDLTDDEIDYIVEQITAFFA